MLRRATAALIAKWRAFSQDRLSQSHPRFSPSSRNRLTASGTEPACHCRCSGAGPGEGGQGDEGYSSRRAHSGGHQDHRLIEGATDEQTNTRDEGQRCSCGTGRRFGVCTLRAATCNGSPAKNRTESNRKRGRGLPALGAGAGRGATQPGSTTYGQLEPPVLPCLALTCPVWTFDFYRSPPHESKHQASQQPGPLSAVFAFLRPLLAFRRESSSRNSSLLLLLLLCFLRCWRMPARIAPISRPSISPVL